MVDLICLVGGIVYGDVVFVVIVFFFVQDKQYYVTLEKF